MHAVIIDDLEGYLAGTLAVPSQRRFREHLETCGECSQEVRGMQEVDGLFACLKEPAPIAPSASFVAQVMQDVAERPAPGSWNPFFDFAFGRRVVFASLVTLAVLGSWLVSRETAYAPLPPNPETVMADQENSPTADRMLVTLTAYEP